ncbi:hypothetical protein ACS0TY_017109 [Phlomoides rotata]
MSCSSFYSLLSRTYFMLLCLLLQCIVYYSALSRNVECSSSNVCAFQISYVLDTEDFFIRLGRRKHRSPERSSHKAQARVEQFHQYLAASVV